MKKRLILIGNGMAGIRCIEEILKQQPDLYDITIFGDEPHPNYNRIMLSHVLQGKTTTKDIIINEYSWYKENNITLYPNEKVITINREKQMVVTEKQRIVTYDKLIIATGSSAFILPIEGSNLPGVTGFRTIEDTQFMINAAKQYKKAVVIGGGLLGLEAARGLIDLGMDVHVVHLMPHLMEQQLDAKAASLLREDLEAQGMKFLMQKKTVKILGTDHVEGIQFEDGNVVPCDLVVMAVGIRPNTQLAKDAGLLVNRGIVVNDYMQTEDSAIYAVGECAEHNGIAYGLVAPLYEQGVVLARHITNTQTDKYKGSIVGTQLKVAGCDLFSAGQIYEDDQTRAISIFNECTRSYKKVFLRDNKVVGIVLYGDTADGTRLFRMLQKEEDIQEYTAVSLLHKAGEESGLDVASMSADDTVCGCNGVTKGTIVQAILEQGLTTFEEVKGCTKAAGSCGKCRPIVEQILSHTLGDHFDPSAQSIGMCGCTSLSRDEVVAAIHEKALKSPKEVRNVLGFVQEDGCSKCRPALNYYLRMTNPEEYADDKASRFVNERMNGNIQHDGTFSVIPRMYGGVTNADDLMRIAEVAKKYDVPLIKITGASRIGLYGVKKEDLPNVWADLDMTSGYAYAKSLRNVKSCVGSRFCRFGTKDSLGLGMLLEQSLEMVDTPHKMKMGVTGCPRNCAEALTKDFGVVCVENGFQLYIGGNGGTEVREADFIMTVPTEEDVLRIATAYVQYYRETGIYGERTAPWVERMGLEHVKEILQKEDMVTALNERFQTARSTYEEAWGQALKTKSLQAMYKVETVQ
ncbi:MULTISPECIES: nitrite reductase large subunit NirB [Bacillus cereus group]|uniref:Nitrite reductase (NAD(P)H), large subunit n=1 Tax=Bacillus cytotoxicus (strain DSM 22905 / CIP 110041 / 391-98 / NVH 391-98) TaxID=315749 RepID=A7GKB7_BACCN|nr:MULTISPECIES: nitrite reductase large subunit NirB [Bacillus cereus group]ABS20575.1 nitrite reductase (NAD(P)H), large subunit [Bacillus cytotoxicus NVH 391-98]AWC43321.1 nitrite reductase large subunit [Bacillus cytotoxicus]MDH2865640.1 nitrite reductase large subunit NirB [Bacillus cytotoxicus]MDH2885655.1 nitrite reductase large subunit NirB [Bacillus cytotoxicus]MDH2890071.1 nitrite reductase large subunit NirB [Bacillus cytotoxicus]